MKTRFFPVAVLCGLLGTGCIPALVTTSPMVSGRITDARTGEPVAGARVTVSVDEGAAPRNGPAKSAPHTVTDGNGQFALAERYGVGPFRLVGNRPPHRAVVRVAKEEYADFTTTQPCNASDREPSTPVHVFAMLKPTPGGE